MKLWKERRREIGAVSAPPKRKNEILLNVLAS